MSVDTKKFIPFQVRELPHQDTDECWGCGATHMEWVCRKRGNPMDWVGVSGRGIRMKGRHESGRCVVDQDSGSLTYGYCYTCKIAQEVGMVRR